MNKSSLHPLFDTWTSMRQRCDNPNRHDYDRYGGQGVTVCQKWCDCFWCFVRDVGPKPGKHYSIDRIDPNGNYEPGNVRWATSSEQRLNWKTPSVHLLTFQGRTQCIAHWAKEVGIDRHIIRSRIVKCRWPVEKALTTPLLWRRSPVAAGRQTTHRTSEVAA